MHTPKRTLRCAVIIMLALCVPHSITAEETVGADLAEASKLWTSLFRSPDYPSESILSPEQLNTTREFITGGNPAIAEILWPNPTPPQSSKEDSVPEVIDTAGAHLAYLDLLWPDQKLMAQLQHPRRADAETARWRFAAQVTRFLKPEYCPLDPFRQSRTLKDYPTPDKSDWPRPGTVDKVITRYKKKHHWMELQDDGHALSMLALRHEGKWPINEAEPIRQALLEFLNLEEEKKERLTVTRKEAFGIVYGEFSVRKDSLEDTAPSKAEVWTEDNFDIWSFPQYYCTDGKYLFVIFRESYDAISMFMGGPRKPDRL